MLHHPPKKTKGFAFSTALTGIFPVCLLLLLGCNSIQFNSILEIQIGCCTTCKAAAAANSNSSLLCPSVRPLRGDKIKMSPSFPILVSEPHLRYRRPLLCKKTDYQLCITRVYVERGGTGTGKGRSCQLFYTGLETTSLLIRFISHF